MTGFQPPLAQDLASFRPPRGGCGRRWSIFSQVARRVGHRMTTSGRSPGYFEATFRPLRVEVAIFRSSSARS